MLANSAVVDRACGLNVWCDSRMRSLAGPSDRFDSSCRLEITSRVLLKQNRTYADCKHASVKTVAYSSSVAGCSWFWDHPYYIIAGRRYEIRYN